MNELLIGLGSAFIIYIVFLIIEWRVECLKKKLLSTKKDYGDVNMCVVCGEPIPEGRQICYDCEEILKKGNID